MRRTTITRWLLAALLLGGVLAGCSDDDSSDGGSTDASTDDSSPDAGGEEQLEGAAFVEPGPYAAGVTSLELASGARLQVWYPAEPGAVEDLEPAVYDVKEEVPASLLEGLEGVDELDASYETAAFEDAPPAPTTEPFPYVVYAHGFAAYPNVSSTLTSHLASWGFVVAAPEFLSRSLAGQLSGGGDAAQSDVEVVAETGEVVAAAGGPLDGLTDTAELAVIGHSAGGGTAATMSTEPGVVTYVPMSAGGARRSDDGTREPIPLGDVPSLWVTGSDDGVAELAGVEEGWATASAPTRLVVVEGAGHNDAFTDICEVGEVPGGAVGLAIEVGFPLPEDLQALGLDGCVPEGLPSADGQALVGQVVTAQLRWAYGIDDEPVGLDEASLEEVGTPFVYEERLG
jgi:dienelactone hydrolase